ncbi:hypothetical protein [Polyangium aurulentum]|uniref:hypothetical protein n=1 Tax=Polyangium aurulentum TaxID=2567896 RepID=UPI0010AE707F|nr:hypothetical protein [Polyangium aurulentum]UQA58277.1 hypothetical protein E8A73_044705 [Polyangium aurulentum]
MKINLSSALVVMALSGSLGAGCGNGAPGSSSFGATASEACAGAPGRAGKQVYVFAGDETQSRVERSLRADGSETISGETTLRADAGREKVIEFVEIDPTGHLVYADISVQEPSGASRRILLDAARGMVFVQDEQHAAWQRMPMDAPWVYGTDQNDAAALLPTPVSAWVAARATASAREVRVFDGARRATQLVASDQLIVEGDDGERVAVAGDAAITMNDDFVTSLGRAPASILPAIADATPTHRASRRVARR